MVRTSCSALRSRTADAILGPVVSLTNLSTALATDTLNISLPERSRTSPLEATVKNVFALEVPKSLKDRIWSKLASESLSDMVLPSSSLVTVPPLGTTVDPVPIALLCMVSKFSWKVEALTRSLKENVSTPSLRSNSYLVSTGGSKSGTTSDAWRALPSVFARTSTPKTSSMAKACTVKYVFSTVLARFGMSLMRIMSGKEMSTCTS